MFSSKQPASSNQHRGAFSQQQQVTTKVWSYRQDSRSQSKPRLWKRNTSREGKIGNSLGIVESPGQDTGRMMDSDLSQETVRGSGEISIAQLSRWTSIRLLHLPARYSYFLWNSLSPRISSPNLLSNSPTPDERLPATKTQTIGSSQEPPDTGLRV